MKKGLFNKKHGLRSAVISGRKTVTRRICKNQTNPSIEEAKWKIGEVIAVAQSYEDMANEGGHILANMLQDETTFKKEYRGVGWRNAMFTKPDLMPHRIRITNIRVEHLQDISDEDCLNEGISRCCEYYECSRGGYIYDTPLWEPEVCPCFGTPQEAFASLIDKVSGNGTWDSNPYVFSYSFELVK